MARIQILPDRLAGAALALALGLASSAARAELGFTFHAEGAVAHLVGDRAGQFGWGAAGLVAPELRLGTKIGLELPVGVTGVAGAAATDAMYAATSAGAVFFAVPGIRLRPLAGPTPGWGDALWLAGGGGVADAAGIVCPAVDVRLGADLRLGPVTMGPFAGYLQIVDTRGGVRPSDARVLFAGLHFPIEGRRPSPSRAPSLPAAPAGAVDEDGPTSMVETCPGDPAPQRAREVDERCPEQIRRVEAPAEPLWVTVDAPVPFDVGSSVITRSGRRAVARLAEELRAHPEWDRVRVVGHADDSGTRAFNLRLSELRARMIEAALVALGVPGARLSVAFFGNEKPLRREGSVAARQVNRRVELEIPRRRAEGGVP